MASQAAKWAERASESLRVDDPTLTATSTERFSWLAHVLKK